MKKPFVVGDQTLYISSCFKSSLLCTISQAFTRLCRLHRLTKGFAVHECKIHFCNFSYLSLVISLHIKLLNFQPLGTRNLNRGIKEVFKAELKINSRIKPNLCFIKQTKLPVQYNPRLFLYFCYLFNQNEVRKKMARLIRNREEINLI